MSGVPNTRSPLWPMPGTTFESAIPAISGDTSATKPARGPAMPISNSTRLERIAERIRIKAPMVPIKLGNGMKNGRVTSTR